MAEPGRLAPYRAVLASRIRAQRSYRSSFRIEVASSLLIGVVELAELWTLFRAVPSLGGLTFAQVLLVFGLADVGFSLADMVVGHCDELPDLIRAGTLEVLYLRPQPLLLQLITSDISLKRLARAAVGLVCIVAALRINPIDWTPAHVAMLALAVVSSTATFAAIFVLAAGLQFFLVNGAEATNAAVYGGRYAATQPASVWRLPVLVAFGAVLPVVFTGYLPALVLLDLPGPSWAPGWLGWCAPLAAAWTWALALLAWRVGVRHYQGAGG